MVYIVKYHFIEPMEKWNCSIFIFLIHKSWGLPISPAIPSGRH